MATQIRVKAQDDGQIVYLDLEGDQPITATFQFKDIQDFKNTKGNHTFSFRIPSTPNNNLFFNQYFEVTQFGNFNPNKRVEATIVKNTIEVFYGYIQLTNVIRSTTKPSYYECVIFSGVSSLGQVLKGKYLTEFDWSALSHFKSLLNVTNSWTGGLHNGDVVYSLYDYGQAPMYGGQSEGSILNQFDAYNINALIPQVRVKRVLDEVIGQSGFTYNSSFFDDDSSGGKLFIDANVGGKGENPIDKDYYHVNAQSDGTQVITEERFANLKNINTSSDHYTNDALLLDSTTGEYTTPANTPFSDVNVSANIVFKTSESNNNFTTAPYKGCDITIAFVEVVGNNSNVLAESTPKTLSWSLSNFGSQGRYYEEKIDFPETRVSISGSKTYAFQIRLYKGGFEPSAPYTRSMTITHAQQSIKPMVGYNGGRYTEYTTDLDVNFKYLFPKIKAIDFLTSLAKKFNLVIIPDKLDSNKLTIEPYSDWIGQGNNVDWSSKIDDSKDIQFKPTSELQAKTLVFSDAEANDNMNSLYLKSSGRIYGSMTIDNDNDFGKRVDKVNTIFKPVITTFIPYTTIKYCVCYEGEGEKKVNADGIRLSYYNGVQYPSNPLDKIWLTDGVNGFETQISTYPLFSNYSTSDILPETECLSFFGENTGMLNSPAPFRSAYNVYWRPYLLETYSRNSRLLIANFNLNAVDIMTMNFNDIIEVEGVFYRINKISNYSMVGDSTCKVELIKVETSNIIASDGSECDITPFRFQMNGNVTFKNKSTGAVAPPTQQCCEAYGYEWNPTTNTCYGRTLTTANITAPTIQVVGSDYDVSGNQTSIYIVDNGIGNSTGEFTMTNGSANDVKIAPKKLIINGARNKVSGSVKTANIDGDNNEIQPYQLMLKRFDPIYQQDKTISIKQNFRNVKLKGDYGFAIASNSEFESPTKLTDGYGIDNPVVEAVTGEGSFITSVSLTGTTFTSIGQDGQFDDSTSLNYNRKATTQGNNYIKLPYPSLMRGEVKVTGTPSDITYSNEYADEIFEFEVNNQTSALDPVVSIAKVGGKSKSTPNFNSLDLTIQTATPSTYYVGNEEKYINDGMFAYKIDQSSMPSMGKINYNLKVNYSLIHDKTRSRIPFDPNSITSGDLVLWLDPNDASTITKDANDFVTIAADKSNFYSNIYLGAAGGQTTTPKLSTLPNSNNSAFFFDHNIGSQMLWSTNFSLYRIPYYEDSTMFVVHQSSIGGGSTYGDALLGTSYYGGTPNYGLVSNATTSGSLGGNSTTFINGGYGTGSWSASLNTIPSTDLQVSIGTHYGSHQGIEDQLGNTSSNNNASSPFANQFSMGGYKDYMGNIVAPFNGYICEVLVYHGNLSTAEKDQVKEYLLSKWIKQ